MYLSIYGVCLWNRVLVNLYMACKLLAFCVAALCVDLMCICRYYPSARRLDYSACSCC